MKTIDYSSLKIPIWGLFIISLMTTLYFAKSIFIPIFLAAIIAFLLSPVVSFLTRLYIPRALGSAVVIIFVTTIFSLLLNYLSEPVSLWLERLPSEISNIEQKLSPFRESIETVQKTTETVEEIASMEDTNQTTQDVVVQGPNIFHTLLDGTQALLISSLSFVVLLYFGLAFGHTLAEKAGSLFQDKNFEEKVSRISSDVQKKVSRYLLLITGINVVLGAIAALLMWVTGMPNPLVWGVSTAFFNFIPYIGPAINLCIITLVSLLTFDGLTQSLIPPALLLLLNLLEGQFVQPMFIGRMFTINPLIIFLSVLIWGWVWGMAGMFMAVPLLVIAKIIMDNSEERASYV